MFPIQTRVPKELLDAIVARCDEAERLTGAPVSVAAMMRIMLGEAAAKKARK